MIIMQTSLESIVLAYEILEQAAQNIENSNLRQTATNVLESLRIRSNDPSTLLTAIGTLDNLIQAGSTHYEALSAMGLTEQLSFMSDFAKKLLTRSGVAEQQQGELNFYQQQHKAYYGQLKAIKKLGEKFAPYSDF